MNIILNRILLITLLMLLAFTPLFADDKMEIGIITIDKIINPITASYIKRTIKSAENENIDLVILLINTPGGLMQSMNEITSTIINSQLIVAGYTYPSGARAASAGAFIMMSCDIAAMAPATHIGAASPVSLMGKQTNETLKKKIFNDAIAQIESFTKKHGRNSDIAKKMVKDAISITEDKALKLKVIEYKSESIETLIKKLNGKTFLKKGKKIKLNTSSYKIKKKEMSLVEKFLYHIAHPNIAMILMTFGVMGILAELRTPGVGFPGVFGGICLILAFFSLSVLPINLAGLLLIFLAIILFILEMNLQTGGILGIGAGVSLILGALFLVRNPMPQYKLSIGLVIALGIFTISFFTFITTLVSKIFKKKVITGKEGLIGEIGLTKTNLNPKGTVFNKGEYWNAVSEDKKIIKKGSEVIITGVEHMTLRVKIKK